MHNLLSPETYQAGTNEDATAELESLFGANLFDNPKPSSLIRVLCRAVTYDDPDALVMDFFCGSGSTADALMQLNAEDGGNRRFIMVQLPEPCEPNSAAFKAGYHTIAEISKERIRRAGKKMLEIQCHEDWKKDIGFRVLKADTSNMADVYYQPDALHKANLDLLVENIKPDRTPEDLLFQVMLDWGVDLSLPVKKKIVQGKDVYFVDDDALACCFDEDGGVDESFIKELAAYKPLRAVCRDAGFMSSAVRINIEQIFRLMSPRTEIKVL
jgi:adenine-specific DNA-methyltransferase